MSNGVGGRVESASTRRFNAACSTIGIGKAYSEAIETSVGGEDVFACLPTGYAKSLCFALLPTFHGAGGIREISLGHA